MVGQYSSNREGWAQDRGAHILPYRLLDDHWAEGDDARKKDKKEKDRVRASHLPQAHGQLFPPHRQEGRWKEYA